MKQTDQLKRYFANPFPKAKGFSPYRNPGPVVHYPVMLVSLAVGYFLCGENPWLWPLLPIYLIVGVYLGRDWAIAAHYNLFLTIFIWIVTASLWVFYPQIPSFAALMTNSSLLASLAPVLVSVSVLALFSLHIWRQVKLYQEDDAPPQ